VTQVSRAFRQIAPPNFLSERTRKAHRGQGVAKPEANLVAGRDFKAGCLTRWRNRLNAGLCAVNDTLTFEFSANCPRDVRDLY